MLQFSRAQIDELLSLLNEPRAVRAWARVGAGEPRRRWRAGENAPLYSAGERYWLLKRKWLEDRLEELRRAGRSGMWLLVSVDDVFSYSGRKARVERDLLRRLSFVSLPLEAFRVASSVFTYDSALRRWRERPWLGHEHDPLLRLPYTRKYDRERNALADFESRLRWERLARAADLLTLALERLYALECPWLLDDLSSLPPLDLADIDEALAQDGFVLSECDISAAAGRTLFELSLFEYQWLGNGRYERRLVRPALASGSYEGALAKVRYKSEATKKEIARQALERLAQQLHALLYPLSSQEQDARLQESERLRHEVAEVFSDGRSRR